MSGIISFQQMNGLELTNENYQIDIAVFILWFRQGSAVGPLIKKEDKYHSEFCSGTEREFYLMLKVREESGLFIPMGNRLVLAKG